MPEYEELKSIKEIDETEYIKGGSPTCSGCGPEIALKLALKALGKNVVLVNSSGCHTLLCNYPNTPLKVPWIHNAIENVGATISGIVYALKKRGREAVVVGWAGDGASYDIGFQALSGAAERGDPFVFICYNNQSYANTGNQWDSATPYLASTKTTPVGKAIRGNPWERKNMVKIMGAHGIYSASATIAFPLDYMNKVRKAASLKKPAFIDVLCSCIPDWGIDSKDSMKLSKLAVETGFWPLYEVENCKFKLTHKVDNLKSVREFLKLQGRYRHLSEEEIKKLQNLISKRWQAILDGKFWETPEV